MDQTPQPNVTQTVPMFAVADMAASVRFYVDGLSFEITSRWEPDGTLQWCRLDRGGGALMLQQFPTEGHNAFVPEGKVGEGVSINFQCEDALAIYHEAVANGLDVKTPFVGNAMWVTGFTDPDGYRLFFESDTDVPEETVYSQSS